MMRRILKALFSVALAGATFGLPAPGAAAADSPVTVQVEGGYGGVVPRGGWAPIQVSRLMVERGRTHTQAVCAVASHLAGRIYVVARAGRDYVWRDLEGNEITKEEARAIA